MNSRLIWQLAAGVAVFFAPVAIQAQEPEAAGWGHLKGRFLFKGDAPRVAVNVPEGADRAWLQGNGHLPILDESLLVDPKTGGLANVCVWLYRRPRDEPPPIHPDLQLDDARRMPDDKARRPLKILTLEGGRVKPHISTVQPGEEFVVRNNDGFAYGVKIHHWEGEELAEIVRSEDDIKHTFEGPCRLPAMISCAIHPWVKGYLNVQPHPYVAVTDAEGRFEIRNLPAGEWSFTLWHEKYGYIRHAEQNGVPVAWPKGRVGLKIEADETTDLGTVTVDPKKL